MQLAWRDLPRGRVLLLGLAIAVLVGAAAALYGVYDNDAPLTLMSERPNEPQLSTPANNAVEIAPAALLSAVLEARRDELERDPNAPVLGNPQGDVTVVEFFDYN